MKIIELILDEEQDDIGVEAISIVESPAIESDFVALKNQEIKLAEVDKEKKILMGALLIPNKPIYRNGEQGYRNPKSRVFRVVCKLAKVHARPHAQERTNKPVKFHIVQMIIMLVINVRLARHVQH